MKSAIDKFVKGALLIAEWDSVLEHDRSGYCWKDFPETIHFAIYRAGDRLIKVRRFPRYDSPSLADCFFRRAKPKYIGEDYESEIITKDVAFKLLTDAAWSMSDIIETLDNDL